MKRINSISKIAGCLFLIASVIISCSEDQIGQTATNKTPPSPLTNVIVTPTHGFKFKNFNHKYI